MHKQKFKENSFDHIGPKLNRLIITHCSRSTLRDWSADKIDYLSEVCNHVLAHKRQGEVEVTYLRGTYLEKRKRSMAN